MMNKYKFITFTNVAYSDLLELLDRISFLPEIQYHNPVISYENNIPIMIIRTSADYETLLNIKETNQSVIQDVIQL